MKAIVATRPGPPEVLKIQDVPTPVPGAGQVLIRVRAFGLNRAELFTRQGHSPGVEFPRILGVECVGEVESAPGGEFEQGQKVATLMGGMGRLIDGGYAEYTLVEVKNTFPLDSKLEWSTLGAIPEMFQTVYGSLIQALGIRSGQAILIRGGTSSIGLTSIRMAKARGLTVLATTRNAEREGVLKEAGADHMVIETGDLIEAVHKLYPRGVDHVLELIGTTTLRNSLRLARSGGVVCMTGILGNSWVIENFEPFLDIPPGVRLTTYSGEADNITSGDLADFINEVEAGHLKVKIDRVFKFDEIVQAHHYMEANKASGKLVVLMD